jgi:hypothetical protein
MAEDIPLTTLKLDCNKIKIKFSKFEKNPFQIMLPITPKGARSVNPHLTVRDVGGDAEIGQP